MRIVDAVNKLKSGIENGNLNEVEEAYTLLTGEKVTFPDDDYSSVTEYPSAGVSVSISKSVVPKEPDFTMNNNKTESIKKEFINKFDPGLDADEEDGYDTINDNVKPVERTRKPHKNVDVFCQDCKQTISVNPQFKREPYFCEFIKLGQKCPYQTK